MRKLAICLISGALASCATQPPNPWVGLDTDTSPAVTSIDCGTFPLPDSATKEHITYSKAGSNALDDYRLCSEDNKDLVDEHAAQIDQLKISRKGLTEAGIVQRNIADMKETMLRDERRHNFWNNLGLYVVIIGMGFAL